MRITGWTNFKDESLPNITKASDEYFDEATEFIISEMKTYGYKFNSKDHQEKYCPVIDNEYIFGVSARTWGEIMVKAHDLPNEDGYGYLLWILDTPKDETPVYPEIKDEE